MYLEQDGEQTKINQQMEPRSYLPIFPLGSKELLKGTEGHTESVLDSVALIRISGMNQLKHSTH